MHSLWKVSNFMSLLKDFTTEYTESTEKSFFKSPCIL